MAETRKKADNPLQIEVVKKYAAAIFYLYLFLLAITMMGTGLESFKSFAEELLKTARNPVLGLFIGLLATAIVQSSSCVTSIIVVLCGSGLITIEDSIPMIMGSNIGTSVTNTLVSIGYFRIRAEFRRAAIASTVHDFFNILTVIILFPIQITTNFLGEIAQYFADKFFGIGALSFISPIKVITHPVVSSVKKGLGWWGFGSNGVAIFMTVFGLFVLFVALILLTRTLREYLIDKIASAFDKILGRSGYLCLLVGMVVTAIIQSSSVVTSLLVPLAASGVATIEQIYPITLGANIGTTITAVLASLAAGNVLAITTAFSHTLFNLIGVLIFFVIKPARRIPISLATFLGNKCSRRKYLLPLYIIIVFFLIPILVILISRVVGD
jgi:sodium-dependent phosphate cotransporter